MKRFLAPALIAAAVLAPTAASAYSYTYYDPNTACTYTVWVLEDEPARVRTACR